MLRRQRTALFVRAKREDSVSNLKIARGYLRAMETGEAGAALNRFLTHDVVLAEFPSRLTPVGKRRDLAAALEGAEGGKKAMFRQIYKIKKEIADHDRVALEAEWVGTLAVHFGCIPAGARWRPFSQPFWSPAKGRSSSLDTTIVAKPGRVGKRGSTRVLFEAQFLWYRSAIV